MKTLLLLLLSAVVASAAPNNAKTEKEVLAAVDAWKQAMLKKDLTGLEKVLHADVSYGHSSGLIENKAQAVEHVITSKANYAAIELLDTAVRTYGTFALVTGKVNMRQV